MVSGHDADRHRDHVPRIELDLGLAVIAPIDRPAPRHGDEHLDGGMRMERRPLARLGADIGDVEVLRVGDRRREVWILRHAGADDVEDVARVLGQAGVDERLIGRRERAEPGGPRQHLVPGDLFVCHVVSPVLVP